MFKRFRKYRYLIALLCVATTYNAYAQVEVGVHRIGLQTGYLYTQSRDELASPLRYSGGTLPLALSYQYAGDEERHQVNVAFRSGGLESALAKGSDHKLTELASALSYTYLTQVFSSDYNQFRLYAGGMWSASFVYRKYTYTAQFHGDETYGALYSSLSAAGYAEYDISEFSRVSARLSLPVVTYAVRPGYTSRSPAPEEEDDFQAILKGGRFASWGSYQAFDLGLSYTYVLSSLFDVEVQYRLSYSHYDKPQPIATAVHAVNLGLLLKL